MTYDPFENAVVGVLREASIQCDHDPAEIYKILSAAVFRAGLALEDHILLKSVATVPFVTLDEAEE